jgi:outer membrane protein
VPRHGAVPRSVNTTSTSGMPNTPNTPTPARPRVDNFFNFGLTATQLIYDFGASHVAYRASKEVVRAQAEDERAVERDVTLMVRVAFFQARALSELVSVSMETLANEQRHLEQAQAFVEVGTRADIDLATGRTKVANARVALIQAENAYAIGKASLNQAMGLDDSFDYQVAQETLGPVPEEERSGPELYRAAAGARPELLAMERRARAQRLYLRSARGGYGPALSGTGGLTAGGTDLSGLVGNWNAGVVLTWPLFEGGATRADVMLAEANQQTTLADQAEVRLNVRFEVEQARLDVRAAKAIQEAANEALESAREQFKLAEGRYAEGVGNVIELGDAQLALTSSEAQRVQADYGLSIARASLWRALGRSE